MRYTTSRVTRGTVARVVSATGTVNPVLTIIVGTYVSGVIQQLFCDYNTLVKRGQVCAKIDPRPYQTVVNQTKANLAVAKAQLEKDKANLEFARVRYERYQELLRRDSVARELVDNAKNAYAQAVAQIDYDQALIAQRQAELDAAQVNLEYTNITAPVDGIVVSRNVTQGQTVAASFQTPTLFLIATDLTKMQVDTNVSETDIGGIREGNEGTFTVDTFPRRVFSGKVVQVRQSPQTVQNVVTYDVVVGVDNTDLALKPGMTAATRIVIAKRDDVVRVPNRALRYTPASMRGGDSGQAGRADPSRAGEAPTGRLFVLRDGEPVAVPVVLGLDDDSFTEIVKGDINPGDEVIVAEDRRARGASSALPRLRL